MSAQAHQRGTGSAPPAGPHYEGAGPHYEDFSVGRRTTATRRRHPGPGDPSTPAGIGGFLALATDGGVLPPTALRVLETRWREVSSTPGEEATFTVTRCRRVPAESAGSVQWHARVHDGAGRTVQEGTIEVLLPARSAPDEVLEPAERAFGSRPWGEALARRLAEDERFGSATATWDGTIGLRAGSDQVQLRVYRGRIIEVAGRTPLGATFTLEGPEHLWTELMTGPSNDFFRRAMGGHSFTVTGNAYEYLRLSKALMVLVDAARELATGARA